MENHTAKRRIIMTITSTTHNIEINTNNGIEYWSREEDSDGVLWIGTNKHFRKWNSNDYWEERPNNGWAKCSTPLMEMFFQEWLKNQNSPQNGAWLYEKALEEAKNNNLTLDEE